MTYIKYGDETQGKALYINNRVVTRISQVPRKDDNQSTYWLYQVWFADQSNITLTTPELTTLFSNEEVTATAAQPGGSVAVANTTTPVVEARDSRSELTLTNDSDTAIYLRLAGTGAKVGQGLMINANGGSYTTDKYTGAVSAIHAGTGTKNLCVVEV